MAIVALTEKPAAPPQTRNLTPPASRALTLPLAFALALAGLSLVPSIGQQPRLFWSILGAGAVLVFASVAMAIRYRGQTLAIHVQPRPQHYLQACAQLSVLLYWGWYWRPVYDAAPLIAAQLAFAYAFEMLLVWSRRETYTLGFGPFPVIFSINLFLWFKPEWFYLQFAMIAVGFAAKQLIRWDKNGRRVHIFNPSSFPLSLFSVALILTGTTSWTFGAEIAQTQFYPPNIYVMLFLVGLPGQLLFGVTTMTMSAVVTTYAFGLLYFAATGTYFFIDSYIPIAVFLGMHLLFTDPSTSPRTEVGRILFGMIYGLSNVALYALLRQAGLPAFYDKLLPVPIMNLSIRFIDRMASTRVMRWFDPMRILGGLSPRRRHLVYIGVWSLVFAGMRAVEGVGDNHPGHLVPFWQQACQEERPGGCATLGQITLAYCKDGSGWACNELGVLESRIGASQNAVGDFTRACDLGFAAGCRNAATSKSGLIAPVRAAPQLADYPVVLQRGKGLVRDRTPLELFTEACGQGWMVGCEQAAFAHLQGRGTPRNPDVAVRSFEKACDAGIATSCSNLGFMYYSADGVAKDEGKGLSYLKRSCEMGYRNACQWLTEIRTKRQ